MNNRVAIYNCTMSQEVNDIQVDLLVEFAESVPDWIFSASNDVYSDVGVSKLQVEGRPALEEVLSKAKKREYDLIVLKSYKNLVRDTNIIHSLINELIEYGVGFMFLDEGIMTLDAMDNCKLVFVLSDEVRMKKMLCSDFIGYKTVNTDLGLRYELEVEMVPLVLQIYGRVLEGASLENIRFSLEFEGFLNARGEDDWSIDMIKDILNNPIYKGETDKGVVVTPILTSDMWDLVQQVMS